jgi:glutathione peroxidase
MGRLILTISLGVFCMLGINSTAAEPAEKVLHAKMKSIDGKDVDLAQYQGKVVLIVNVASRCGYTPQYKGLEELYEKYKDQGFVILGFPCNQFGKQEPGTEAEIAQFCSANYGVTFPMFAKVEVNGPGACQLYKTLKSSASPKGDIKWNFEKFLINKNGEVVGRYLSKVKPEGEDLRKAIETELKK